MSQEFAPQTTQLKDALRALRYNLRKGRDSVRATAPRRLPAPASGLALSALNEVEIVARNLDHFVCNVAHSVLGERTKIPTSLRAIIASPRPEQEFSVTYYETMKLVLSRIGAKRALANQSAGRRAFAQLARSQDVFELAAQLTLYLADDGSIAIDQLDEQSPVTRSGANVVAVFAGLLSMLADPDEPDREAMIPAATELALALQEKVLDLYHKKDTSALAALLERCANHV
ncbi:hypothetical protein DB728_08975 [Rhizobium leguminosarum bv. viciae USDA 2370]|nr:hypothetical protein CHR56_25690 [Rhizobium leguminosarum bv. viciae]OOO46942.1 hypothetical protein BS629_20365 [Rhizobium leguminosarum bv. viciae USDA 2370]PUB65216.1 hypothetical protein DB728_08975 [Rhizobium leguminosarum bv. viciae USDA 2370]